MQLPLISPPGVRAQHCHKDCLQEKKQHIVSDRESLSGCHCCSDREESVCFSSTASLCLTYQTLLAVPVMTATPVTLVALRAVDPEQLSSPQPDFFPDQPALRAEAGRGHTKIQYVRM